ncbi:major facilitator superfamily domain-containing protein [Rhypophila decipiens]|uniref:Major facilitator superfamily domain-containing protein n=1 Tax=Rhypophila decipiens TaxID=261697 RepID=A0AAN7BB36_9PEZI|nr:major facilitator superfamily domain-containing protein [Rhypophila decipiens]
MASSAPPGTSSSSASSHYDLEAGNQQQHAAPPKPASSSQQRLSYPTKPVKTLSLVFDMAGIDDDVLTHPYPGQGTPESPYIIDFLPGFDQRNPLQYEQWRKWTITCLQAMATLAVAFVSTAYSGGIMSVIKSFDVGTTVAICGVSLFVFGFAVGPLLWAPLSEFYGRQIIFFITYMALTVFNAGATGSKNIETLIILRFFAGAFGSSPLTNSGGVIADIFLANERGPAGGIFSIAPFLGPAIGPIAGGFLGESEGWVWIEGLMAIFTGVLWIICSLFVPETYAPVILRRRAAKLSALTGKVYISKMDMNNTSTKWQQIRTALSRPWILLFREPIVFMSSIYIAIVYGTLYLMFAAFPIVFQQGRGWSPGIGGLAFIGVAVGMMVGVAYATIDNKRYVAIAAKSPDGNAPPEARLVPALVGSILLPVGLFWFAWTNGASIHWIVPIIASSFFAAGLVMVFLSLLGYLLDSYTVFAASVLAANAVLRSLFGAAFPLFTMNMYENLGLHWASSVPAFLALACVPFPFLFWKFGARIRMKCKYAAEAALVLERMRREHRVIGPEEAMEEIVRLETIKSQTQGGQQQGHGILDLVKSITHTGGAEKEGQEKKNEEKGQVGSDNDSTMEGSSTGPEGKEKDEKDLH